MNHEFQVTHGDIFKRFSEDEQTVLMYGVSRDLPARAGLAFRVLMTFFPTKEYPKPLDTAHYGYKLGDIVGINPRVYSAVTQPDYHQANVHYISTCISAMTRHMESKHPDCTLLVPLIGGGLGGLLPIVAKEAIRDASRHRPVHLYLWP